MGLDNLVGHLFQEARAGKIRLRTHPASVKDYIFIDDAVRMLGRIGLGGRERIYNVASGEQMEHRQWLTALSGFTGCIVEVDQNAPLQSFPAINVERMKREFGFKPTPISEVVQLLLMNLNTFG
jgi:nucleoside-diphosphate-sugar epimerase